MTGLSGSGKTAFITSLVENLISAPEQPARLPFLRAAAEGRIVDVVPRRSGHERIADFPLSDTVAALAADPPRWPATTTDLRQIDVAVRFSLSSIFGLTRPIGGVLTDIAELDLHILDYPGEWLLDLPLLSQSYQEWSAATLDLARNGARASLSREWLGFLADHPPSSRSDNETAKRAHDLYRTFLAGCRHQAQLSMLQPGRFLNPGRLAGDVVLEFCPMPAVPAGRDYEGSLAGAMKARFEAYKRHVVQPFFAELAHRVDRQVVLVDVLRMLNAGEEAFVDQSSALATILRVFRFGRHGFLRRLFGARIDRVLFAATKADHVPAVQRDHLEALVADMVAVPRLRAEQLHARVAATALASIRCTVDDTDVIDGRKVDVVIGLPQGGQRRIRFFPGIIPVARPLTGFWGDRFTEFPVFQPPRIDAAARRGIPHVNLDKALNFLFEDILR